MFTFFAYLACHHAHSYTVLANMRLKVEPRAEWATSFGEAVRDVRDYFVDAPYAKAKWLIDLIVR